MKNLILLTIIITGFSLNLFAQPEFMEKSFNDPRFNKQQLVLDEVLSNIDSLMLDSIIIYTMETFHIPGLQTLIIKNDAVVSKRNYGYANVGLGLPVEDSTLFLIASISKTIVATAFMKLWEDGLVNLDDNINDYLFPDFQVINPSFPTDSITIKMLLTHTSSIKDNWPIIRSLSKCGDSPISLDSFLVNYFTEGGTYYSPSNFNNFAPSSLTWDYSNTGSVTLAYIVEKLSGISFDQYCEQNIFQPLIMNETSWFLSGMDTANIATPYDWLGGQYVPNCHLGQPYYPICQLRTNTTELGYFLSAYMNGGKFSGNRILDSTTVDLMLSDQLGHPDPYGDYQGLIWYKYQYDGRWLWGHEGGWNDFSTSMFFNPEEDWGVIMLMNLYPDDQGHYGILHSLCNYAHLYGNIYALNTNINKPYIKPFIDTLSITTKFVNINQHDFLSNTIYISSDSSSIDSVALYDDGMHGDSLAGDGIWGGYIHSVSEEEIYNIGISTIDIQTGEYFFSEDLVRFTTAGPIVIDSLEIIYNPFPKTYKVRLFVRNEGQSFTVENLSITMSSDDSLITYISSGSISIASIAPGAVIFPTGSFTVRVDSNFSTPFRFNFEIKSGGWLYWKDSIGIVTSVEDEQTLPISYKLSQNYPNPFNPLTKIKYSVPQLSNVVIKVFDILGNEIETLVNEDKPTGTYELTWFAEGLPSGVYVYQLKTGNIIETKKMILTK